MKILHVTPHIASAHGGGVAAAAFGLAEAQRTMDHRVSVLCSREAVSMSSVNGIEVMPFETRGPKVLMFSPDAERWARSKAAGEFDLLHQHGIWQFFSRVTEHWRAAHRKPTLVAPHGSLESWAMQQSKWKKWFALRAYESANLERATCIQVTTAQEITGIRALGLRNPVAIIPNGVSSEWLDSPADPAAFRRAHGFGEDRRLMLFMSRFHRKKGLLELLRAFASAGDALRDWDLVLAGAEDGAEYAAAVRNEIAALGLDRRAIVVGELDSVAKRNALAASELFVLPTNSDNFAIVIAEALGAGVPVLTTEGAIAWQSLETEQCGWWIPRGVDHLADKLRAVAQLPASELEEMGSRGARLIRRKFLWSHAAEQSLEVYQWMVGGAPRPDCVST